MWSPIGAGLDGPEFVYGYGAFLDNTEFLVSGRFGIAGGAPAGGVATLTTPCVASVAALGAGCPSSGGPNLLTATAPWTGSVPDIAALTGTVFHRQAIPLAAR
jgi:hypothetical protein